MSPEKTLQENNKTMFHSLTPLFIAESLLTKMKVNCTHLHTVYCLMWNMNDEWHEIFLAINADRIWHSQPWCTIWPKYPKKTLNTRSCRFKDELRIFKKQWCIFFPSQRFITIRKCMFCRSRNLITIIKEIKIIIFSTLLVSKKF